jgi:chemotaxis protein histidine kinase CheA
LAELHGGSLHIESEKGAGTAVTLVLPGSRVISEIAELVGAEPANWVSTENETLKAET